MAAPECEIKIFGIRHHGPGSAKSVRRALENFKPDCVLIEGPSDADELIAHVANSQEPLIPPVALLIYAQDNARQAAYFPFAEFSPEWQAMQYAISQAIPCKFMDLPQSIALGLKLQNMEILAKAAPIPEATRLIDREIEEAELAVEANDQARRELLLAVKRDPIGTLAGAAGFSDGERWWEQMVEQRLDDQGIFQAIEEAMSGLRDEISADLPVLTEVTGEEEKEDLALEPLREAYMRSVIRKEAKSARRLAVICGAWHSPALSKMPSAKDVSALLKGLPKLKVEATWIPWTHGRLQFESGYGAGVESPGWYRHVFKHEGNAALSFLVQAASLLRDEGIDASSAQVIDAVRLAHSLAAMRELSHPGLVEMKDAILSVICQGNPVPLSLIEKRLLVGESLGSVPETVPSTPLAKDLERLLKTLRMKREADEKLLELDLRKENDKSRSELFSRLNLLSVPWGEKQILKGKISTFHENWKLKWRPELSLYLIEASLWGRTIEEAAGNKAIDRASTLTSFDDLVELLASVLDANLKEAAARIIAQVEAKAALEGDIAEAMLALPTLARIARYGDVKGTDVSLLSSIIDGLVTRIAINLEAQVSSLDDDAADRMQKLFSLVLEALNLLAKDELKQKYLEALHKLARSSRFHGLVSGKATALMLEAGFITSDETEKFMGFALSRGSLPAYAGHWLEGFLTGKALIIVHDKKLFSILDHWVAGLGEETFTESLPLLRRTFSTFTYAERRQIGERVKQDSKFEGGDSDSAHGGSGEENELDEEKLAMVLPMMRTILGLDRGTKE